MVQFECPRAQALKVASLIQFLSWVVPHFPLIALWDNNNWPPSIKVRKSEKFIGQDGLDWHDCKEEDVCAQALGSHAPWAEEGGDISGIEDNGADSSATDYSAWATGIDLDNIDTAWKN